MTTEEQEQPTQALGSTEGLGPLPDPALHWPDRYHGDEFGYTADQMRSYAAEQVRKFSEFLHSLPNEKGYEVGPARMKYSPNGLLVQGPWWATTQDTDRWAAMFLGGPNVRGNGPARGLQE